MGKKSKSCVREDAKDHTLTKKAAFVFCCEKPKLLPLRVGTVQDNGLMDVWIPYQASRESRMEDREEDREEKGIKQSSLPERKGENVKKLNKDRKGL